MSETPHVPPPGGSFTTPPPPPPGGGSRDTAMLVLSYLWFLSIIPLVAKKEDREVQWHAKNGLIFAIAITAVCIIFGIVGHFFPALGCLLSWVPCLLSIGYLVVVILAIVKATSGQRLRVPMLSDYADKM
ncbi:MAG: DUF4870 domain-containing protein [Acidobacteriota bacterium]|nr:DUF4870 domain-containing protein [Acidobacteriota bacterium]